MSIFDIRSLGEAAFESSSDIPAEIVVIVPLYNYEAFIIDCLNSVAKQTVNNLSVVVVDDEYRRRGMSRQDSTANKNLDTLLPQIALRHPDIFNLKPRTPSVDQDLSICVPLK